MKAAGLFKSRLFQNRIKRARLDIVFPVFGNNDYAFFRSMFEYFVRTGLALEYPSILFNQLNYLLCFHITK